MQDDDNIVREILRDLIKNYRKFPEIIPKLSFINRQDLLYAIGETDVLFRSTLNFSNSIKSQTIFRQTKLTFESDRYKTENMSTHIPEISTSNMKSSLKEIKPIKPKNSKRLFGVIPAKTIKSLDSK